MVDSSNPNRVVLRIPRIPVSPESKLAIAKRRPLAQEQDPGTRPDTLLRAIRLAMQGTGIGTNSGPGRLVTNA